MFSKKTYQLGVRLHSYGLSSDIYRINGYKNLIAKVVKDSVDDSYFKNQLLKDLTFGRLLRKHGISTPRYIGICNLRFQDGHMKEGLVMEEIKDSILIKLDSFDSSKLGVDILTGQDLLRNELKKVYKLPFKVKPGDVQGLYSKKKNKIYLIDFEQWVLCEKEDQ